MHILKHNFLSIKKLLLILLCFILIFTLLSHVISKSNKNKTLASLKELSRGSLYLMNYYDNYKFDKYLKKGSNNYEALIKFFKSNLLISSMQALNLNENWSCSAFSASNQKGEPIYGRNLDIEGSHPGLLLYTTPSKGYASMSMVELTVLGYGNDINTLSKQLLTMKGRNNLLAAPYVPRDGMNDQGLVVATLNTPKADMENTSSKVTIGRWQVVRLLLDKAKDVDEAITLLENFNAFDGEVHYLVSDAKGNSAIIEYNKGKVTVIKKTISYQILTNFIVSDPLQPGTGHDRYLVINHILSSCNGKLEEFEAMNLLKAVSQKSTAWSVLYNQTEKTIYLVKDNNYSNIYMYNIKTLKTN